MSYTSIYVRCSAFVFYGRVSGEPVLGVLVLYRVLRTTTCCHSTANVNVVRSTTEIVGEKPSSVQSTTHHASHSIVPIRLSLVLQYQMTIHRQFYGTAYADEESRPQRTTVCVNFKPHDVWTGETIDTLRILACHLLRPSQLVRFPVIS